MAQQFVVGGAAEKGQQLAASGVSQQQYVATHAFGPQWRNGNWSYDISTALQSPFAPQHTQQQGQNGGRVGVKQQGALHEKDPGNMGNKKHQLSSSESSSGESAESTSSEKKRKPKIKKKHKSPKPPKKPSKPKRKRSKTNEQSAKQVKLDPVKLARAKQVIIFSLN